MALLLAKSALAEVALRGATVATTTQEQPVRLCLLNTTECLYSHLIVH